MSLFFSTPSSSSGNIRRNWHGDICARLGARGDYPVNAPGFIMDKFIPPQRESIHNRQTGPAHKLKQCADAGCRMPRRGGAQHSE